MSYEVLARRLRPRTFADVLGQEHVTQTLRNAVKGGRLPHAILLCGPRGVGKTSIARILARSLNCDSGPGDSPCGTCAACREIAAGNSLDVQEIDAASHTGVENVREIRDSVRYSAAPGKYRIFIIDEVHMLSSAAFNALLKTLEEPPPHSLFVLATTDPQKIPATVLSRVQRFDLRRLGPRDLLERLRQIATAESIEISDTVLRGLIREGGGSFRDVLTLLDRLVSGLGSQIRDEDAARMLDWIDRRVLEDVVDPILARDPAGVLRALERALAKGIEPARLASDLLTLLRDLLVARIVEDPGSLIEGSADEIAELRRRAQAASPESLQQLFRVLLTRTLELATAPRPAHALEAALVRLATLPDTDSIASLVARVDALLAGGAPPPGPERRPAPRSAPSEPARAPSAPRAEGRASPARATAAAEAAARPASGERAARPRAAASAEEAPVPARPVELSAPAAAEAPAPPPSAPEPAIPLRPRGDAAESAPAHRSAAPAPNPVLVDREEQRRLHSEAKAHPAVKEVIEHLDAEIREIRMPRR